MGTTVKVVDLTSTEGNGEVAAIVYFEALNGTVQIYRDGTVVLTSPAGTTVTSVQTAQDSRWRRTHFLGMLARLGATDQELVAADQMISRREAALHQKGFPAAVEEAAAKSAAQFRAWCQQRNLDPETVQEADLEALLEEALSQIRSQ